MQGARVHAVRTVARVLAGVGLAPVLVLVACSHHYVPTAKMAELKVGESLLDGEAASVSLENAQSDSAGESIFFRQGAHKYFTDYYLWTETAIQALEKQLEAHGVRVGSGSRNKVLVRVPKIAFTGGGWAGHTTMVLVLERKDGAWSKTYRTTNAVGWDWNQSFRSTLKRAVDEVLNDPEFVNAIRDRQSP